MNAKEANALTALNNPQGLTFEQMSLLSDIKKNASLGFYKLTVIYLSEIAKNWLLSLGYKVNISELYCVISWEGL